MDYTIRGITGTTVSTFVDSLCDLVLERRYDPRNVQILSVLVNGNARGYAIRTKKEVQPYSLGGNQSL